MHPLPAAPAAYALAGLAQPTYAADDALQGRLDLGMSLNVASGLGMLGAAAVLRGATLGTAAPARAFAWAWGFVALVRVVDLGGSIGAGWDAQALAFVLIVGGAFLSTGGAIAWARGSAAAPPLGALRVGAALAAVGSAGYVFGALIATAGWSLAARGSAWSNVGSPLAPT